MHEEFRPMAIRMSNADAWLINTLMDAAHSKYSFKHGVFLDAAIIKNASTI